MNPNLGDQFEQYADNKHLAGQMFGTAQLESMSPEQYGAVLHSAAMIQLDRPEGAMNEIQRVQRGGAYAGAVEHVGDLTNRMGMPNGNFGLELVQPKVERVHRMLHQKYGFEREMQEDMRSNGDDPQKVLEAGRNYAGLHLTVPVYTIPMLHANRAAVALGMHDFDRARLHLSFLKRTIDNGDYTGMMSQEAAVRFSKSPQSAQHAEKMLQAVRFFRGQR